jgi:hypothetical protein
MFLNLHEASYFHDIVHNMWLFGHFLSYDIEGHLIRSAGKGLPYIFSVELSQINYCKW